MKKAVPDERRLRLRRLLEREVDPADLARVNGGYVKGTLSNSRYCATSMGE